MTDKPPVWGEEVEGRIADLAIRLVVLGFFVHWSLVLVRPFASIFIWAAILAVTLAPLHLMLARRFGGRPRLAAALVCIGLLALLIGPVAALVDNFIGSVMALASRAQGGTLSLPPPPARLADVPLVGDRLSEAWHLAATNLDEALLRYRDMLAPIGMKALGVLSSLSFDLVKFMAAIVIAGFLLVKGRTMVEGGRLLARRLIPPRGGHFVDLAGATVRNVSRGVVGVALLQAILIGLAFEVAGVPAAGLLAFAVLILCIVQIGPGIVVLPVIVWAWLTFDTVPAAALTAILLALTLMDNVLKPILMGRGSSTPTLVIFLGVVGGTLSYGLIGLFLGPIVLGVFYDLLVAWVAPREPATDGGQDGP
ncbi:AI-2E family transporter [Rhodobacter sp. CZR27]|uniref:AI-2E family transporter n=1 Tax=Rhodobacter sp. CZR27 TaxID=2033869 RepID=UPI000BBEDE95|nr:AI-2E family transporter [Rhodobacter sp. CZR27]